MARVVLPIAGAIASTWLGIGWQAGWMVGTAIAGIVDPMVTNGPRMGEATRQTSQPGAYIPLIINNGLVGSNIVAVTPLRKEYKEESSGKGAPKTKNEYVYQTAWFWLCEGIILDVPFIKANGKVVYDTRPGSEMLEDSYEFAKNFRLYTGTHTQMPDPDIEAHFGAGTTCPHRGTAGICFHNFDLTPYGGIWPQFEFEVLMDGVISTPSGGWFFGPVVHGAGEGYQRSPDGVDWTSDTLPLPLSMTNLSRISKAGGALFFHGAGAVMARVSFDYGATWELCDVPLNIDYDVTYNGDYWWNEGLYSVDAKVWIAIPNQPFVVAHSVARTFDKAVVITNAAGGMIGRSIDNGATWQTLNLLALTGEVAFYITAGHLEYQISVDGLWAYSAEDILDRPSWYECVDYTAASFYGYNPYYSSDEADVWMRKSFPDLVYRSATGGLNDWKSIDTLSGKNLGAALNPSIAFGRNIWLVARLEAGSPNEWYINYSIDGGKTFTELDYPLLGNGGNLCYAGPRQEAITTASKIALTDALEVIRNLTPLPADRFDTTDLVGIMLQGIVFAGGYTAREAIDSIRPLYFFDYLNANGELKLVKRGGAIKGTITEDDLLTEFEDSVFREHAGEYPRVLHMDYQLRTNNFATYPAKSERDSEDVLVTGEVSMSTPVIFNDVDEPMQIIDKLHKVLEIEARGEIEIILGEDFLEVTVTDSYNLSIRGRTFRVRFTDRNYADAELRMKAQFERVSAYESGATGIAPPPPTTGGSNVVGDTMLAVANTSAFKESHDLLGVYVFVCGVLAGWKGTMLQMSSNDGALWVDMATITVASLMGKVTATLPVASKYFTDTTNVLSVQLYDDRLLSSIEQDELYDGGNAAIVINRNGTCEQLNFQDVEKLEDRKFNLSTLIRGQMHTPIDSHPSSSYFAMLNGANFIELPASLIGRNLMFRAISVGRTPGADLVTEITFNPAYSQLEPPVEMLEGSYSGMNLTCSWTPIGRFGDAAYPIDGVDFRGYRITLIGSVSTVILPDQYESTFTYDVTTIGAPVTARVQGVNRITGLGTAEEITL